MAKYITISTIGVKGITIHDNHIDPDVIVAQSIRHLQHEIQQVLPDRPDLIVLPEACDGPLGLSKEKLFTYYRVRGERILNEMRRIAKENNCYLAYPAIMATPNGSWRNSTHLINRSGEVIGTYTKNHPTITEIEQGILCGTSAPLIQCDFGTLACAICFDLNFDRLRLHYRTLHPDLILFSSMFHGGLLQKMWAYTCRAYFIGAVAYGGPSAILSPQGEIIATSTNYYNFATARINLDYALVHLDYNRNRLSKMKSKYGPKVKVYDPGQLGSVLITSETTEFSIKEIVAEFELELLDDYLQRALAEQQRHPLGSSDS
ncbi:MAG TPA: carbon-nitrogen hydrolase family protein [Firmicutes bacterium]|nr:carbon-nitrogen hydrolase family protein [Bacillota bacterium]